jgi:hypothetical protein
MYPGYIPHTEGMTGEENDIRNQRNAVAHAASIIAGIEESIQSLLESLPKMEALRDQALARHQHELQLLAEME